MESVKDMLESVVLEIRSDLDMSLLEECKVTRDQHLLIWPQLSLLFLFGVLEYQRELISTTY